MYESVSGKYSTLHNIIFALGVIDGWGLFLVWVDGVPFNWYNLNYENIYFVQLFQPCFTDFVVWIFV